MIHPPTDVHPVAHGWATNSQHVDHKSSTLTLHYQATTFYITVVCTVQALHVCSHLLP